MVVGLVIFVFSDHLFQTKETEIVPEASIPLKPRKPKKNVQQGTQQPTENSSATKPVQESSQPQQPELPVTPPTDTSPDSSVTPTDPAQEPVAGPKTDPGNGQITEPTVEPVIGDPSAKSEAPQVTTSPETPVAETPVAETPVAETPVAETPVAETPVAETPVAETPDQGTKDKTEETGPTISLKPDSDTVDVNQPPAEDDTITDQILSDLQKQARSSRPIEEKKEYVSPPDYEYRGRGLVYNCKGKHWACVDGPSYKTCEDNSSSVKYLKKTTECYPYNIYETVKGCESMQNRMVSSSAKTNFCN